MQLEYHFATDGEGNRKEGGKEGTGRWGIQRPGLEQTTSDHQKKLKPKKKPTDSYLQRRPSTFELTSIRRKSGKEDGRGRELTRRCPTEIGKWAIATVGRRTGEDATEIDSGRSSPSHGGGT